MVEVQMTFNWIHRSSARSRKYIGIFAALLGSAAVALGGCGTELTYDLDCIETASSTGAGATAGGNGSGGAGTAASTGAGAGGSGAGSMATGSGSSASSSTAAGSGSSAASSTAAGSGSSAASSTAAGSGSSSASGGSTGTQPTLVDIEARHVIADPVRGVFYATVAGDAAAHANSLVVVDAASATVKTSVFVGSQPSTMALSDDASTLWVSLKGSFKIRRVDLTSGSPVPAEQFALPPGDFGDLAFAGPMVVLPGTTNSLGISLHRADVSPSYAGSVIVDNGVPRPKKTSGHTGASRLTGGPAGWLCGFNNLHTGFGFYSLKINADGLASTEYDDLVGGFSTDIVYATGRVYATSGEVVDVSNPASPTKAGEFAFDGDAVLPLGAEPRLLMLSAGFSGPLTLRYLNTDTFSQISSETYPNLDLDSAIDLVSTNGKILAFIGSSGGFNSPPRLYLLTHPFSG
jgi:hypothetical protein